MECSDSGIAKQDECSRCPEANKNKKDGTPASRIAKTWAV